MNRDFAAATAQSRVTRCLLTFLLCIGTLSVLPSPQQSRTVSIKGKVTNETGEPIRGLKIELLDIKSTRTREDGTYAFLRLSPGTYTIQTEERPSISLIKRTVYVVRNLDLDIKVTQIRSEGALGGCAASLEMGGCEICTLVVCNGEIVRESCSPLGAC